MFRALKQIDINTRDLGNLWKIGQYFLILEPFVTDRIDTVDELAGVRQSC